MIRQIFLLSVIVGMAVAGMHREPPPRDEVVLTRVLPAALPSTACQQTRDLPPPPDEIAVADAEGPEAAVAEVVALRRAPANRGVVRADHPDYMRRP